MLKVRWNDKEIGLTKLSISQIIIGSLCADLQVTSFSF